MTDTAHPISSGEGFFGMPDGVLVLSFDLFTNCLYYLHLLLFRLLCGWFDLQAMGV